LTQLETILRKQNPLRINNLKLLCTILLLILVGTFANCINIETRQKFYYSIKYWNAKRIESIFIKKILESNYKAAYSFTSNKYRDSISLEIFSKTADSVRNILNKCNPKDTIEIHESWSGNSVTGEKSSEVTFAIPFLCDTAKRVDGYYDAIDIQFKQNGSRIEKFQIAGYFIMSE